MTSIEMINHIKEWALLNLEEKQTTKYRLRYKAAVFLITYDVDIHDEFIYYLLNQDISVYEWIDSHVENFFKQYGIEIY